ISGSVSTSSDSPTAERITPDHWRGETRQPNTGSASTARISTPAAITACTIEIGASASAAMCNRPAGLAVTSPAEKPTRPEQDADAAQRVAVAHPGGLLRASVLDQPANVRAERADGCQRQPERHCAAHTMLSSVGTITSLYRWWMRCF